MNALSHHCIPGSGYPPHLMIEHVALAAGASLFTLSSILLATMDPSVTTPEVLESAAQMRLLLVPLIGGLFTMGGAVFLNPVEETLRIKIGRALIGLFICVVAPQVLVFFLPSWGDINTNPFMLFLIGGLAAFPGFILSRSFVSGIFSRSDRIAGEMLDKGEQKYMPKKTPGQE